MKNNLLTEIERIKDIMFLNESSNQECEAQLEKDGYIVYNSTELKTMDVDCGDKDTIKCVKEWFDENGVDSSQYRIGKHEGLCYIIMQSKKKIEHKVGNSSKSLAKKTWAFWENNDVTFIQTFDIIQTGTTDTNVVYSQAQFKGKYKCDGSDLQYENLWYQGVYEVNKTDKLNKIDGSNVVTYSDSTGKEEKVKLGLWMGTNNTLKMGQGYFN